MKFLLLLIVLGGLIGYYYFHTHPKATVRETADSLKQTAAQKIDEGTQKSFAGVSVDAQIYYLRNKNYGKSETANICTAPTSAGGLGDIIYAMKKLGSKVSCAVDGHFPSKSFTLTVPAVATKNQYYCTDQNGYNGLIPSLSTGNFALGFNCK